MNLEKFKDLATSKMARQILLGQKHSPKILFAAGVVGVVGTVVLACRSTLKMEDVLAETQEKLTKAEIRADVDDVDHDPNYSQEQYHKDVNKIKVAAAAKIVKLYLPAVGIGVVSVAALTGSHVILTKRNTAVMAAYAALQKGYDEYRERVRSEYGEDVDKKFAFGAEDHIVMEKTAEGKTKETLKVGHPGGLGKSPYAVLYDRETTNKWTPEPGMNAVILGVQQQHANDKLRANGHLFLNEVYDMLGLPRTSAGAVVGWVWDPKNEIEGHVGDNHVSFGIWDQNLEDAEAFVNGNEKSVWLDFNVDGVIYNLI